MFETPISKPHRIASLTSVLAHCAVAMVLFAWAGPQAVERRLRSTPIYLPSDTRGMASKPIVVPKQLHKPMKLEQLARLEHALKLDQMLKPNVALEPAPTPVAAMPASNPLPVSMALPENLPVPPPAPPIVLDAVPAPVAPPPTAAVRKLEVRTGGFESSSAPVSRVKNVAIDLRASGLDPVTPQAPGKARSLIASAAFDAIEAKPSPAGLAPHPESGLKTPLEIISKPRPIYTEEGRRLHIEGDVVLQVNFRASSEICVLRVIHSLGHGLDENAIAAAEAIRFRPATGGGHPIDEVAKVRITFQLAD
jgi:TonB family protein